MVLNLVCNLGCREGAVDQSLTQHSGHETFTGVSNELKEIFGSRVCRVLVEFE